tara:strand:- start:30348 stop:31385 length:1038 start_codon:yes stop_codon:yes gene_type:complete
MNIYDELQENLKSNPKVWLVTGVAGFIGSNILEALLSLDQKVIGLDNFATGFRCNIDQSIRDANESAGQNVEHNFRFIEGDISEPDICKNACTGVDYVLHQAALGSVNRSIDDPIITNQANVVGFLNMLVACKDQKVKKFIYASSSSIYGNNKDLPKKENIIGSPLSPYAVTKQVNELYSDVFASIYGLKTIGLRYFNVFGKRQDPNGVYAAVIPKWISKIMKNEQVFVNGDGQTSRDFCYVHNAVQMNLLAATTTNKKAIGQIYNVALNNQTSLNELYFMIQERLIEKVKGLKRRKPLYRDYRKGDIKHSRANIDKAKKLLKYDPKYKISQGLDETIDWYINSS